MKYFILSLRNVLTIIVYLLLILSCGYKSVMSNYQYIKIDELPKLEEKLNNNIIESDLNKIQIREMISSGSFLRAYFIIFDSIKYSIAVDDKNIVKYIRVKDPKFFTFEGITVNSTLQDVLSIQSISENDLIKEPGWAFYLKLPSGWNAAFTVGKSMTDNRPSSDSKVKWLFKR